MAFMECSNCGKSSKTLQKCLICSKSICRHCGKYRLCKACTVDYPIESPEIKQVTLLWGSVSYISMGVGVLAALYWIIANIFSMRLLILDFWGENTELYLLLLIIGITILVSIGSFILKKKIPVMIAELEKLKYGSTKSEYIKPKNYKASVKPKISKKLFSKEEYKPRAHNFMCCQKCSKLNKNTNEFCDECGAKLI